MSLSSQCYEFGQSSSSQDFVKLLIGPDEAKSVNMSAQTSHLDGHSCKFDDP